MSKKDFSITTSIVNVLIWGTAAVFACKWLGFMLDGLIGFKSPYNSTPLLIVSIGAVVGAIIAISLALLSYRHKISPMIQIPMLFLGAAILWAINPFLAF